MARPHRLADSFIHLGLGATAVPQPPFDGLESVSYTHLTLPTIYSV